MDNNLVNKDTCCIIVAGGSGERFGNPKGKQFVDICNKPMVSWSIKAFDEAPSIGMIVIVTAENRLEDARIVARDVVGCKTPFTVVASGASRQLSVLNGLKAVPDTFKYVAIHDGARPLIRVSTIENAIKPLRQDDVLDGTVCGQPAIDTIKLVDGNTIVKTPNRAFYWSAQTPQTFKLDRIIEAHAWAQEHNIKATDDSSLIEEMQGYMKLVSSPRDNIKVTVPEDLRPVQAILEGRLVKQQEKGDFSCE